MLLRPGQVSATLRYMDEARRKLPIGIQTFREIRAEGHYYADKTAHIKRLVENGKHYFLSRPRRFGKSLLLDTIKELFEGSEELFSGLSICEHWNFEKRHPVLRLDFGGGNYALEGAVGVRTTELLNTLASDTGIDLTGLSPEGRFERLLRHLHRDTGERVVVLVDEYDKPILDALNKPEIARANRDFLSGLYGVIKSCDAHIRFTLLTGVSKFSKVNLFSGLNNLRDITLDPRFATICGYTEQDLDTVFAPEIKALDRSLVREWYNGYSWRGNERVYNPFDILLLFESHEFRPWWFETGTPTFLVDTLLRRGVSTFSLDGMIADDVLLSSFEVDDIAPEALLFQTGYLTIEESSSRLGRNSYRLGYPNQEVRQSLNEVMLRRLAGSAAGFKAQNRLLDRFLNCDLKGVEAQLCAIYAGIPTDWHRKNDIAHFEGYYASVFYACLAALGLDLRVEDASSAGRVDLTMRCDGHVYLFEFKVIERAGEGSALEQLIERRYADKYRASGQPIHCIGVEFSEETRNINAFEVAPVHESTGT